MFPIFPLPVFLWNALHVLLLVGTLGAFADLFVNLYERRKDEKKAKESGERIIIGRSAIAAATTPKSQLVQQVAILAALTPILTIFFQPNPLVVFIPILLVIAFFKVINFFSETCNKKPGITSLIVASLALTLTPLGYSAYQANSSVHTKTYYLDSARNPSSDEQRNKLVTKISERDNGDGKKYKWVESSPQGVVETWGEIGAGKATTTVIVDDLQVGEEPYTTHTITLTSFVGVGSKQLCPLNKSLVKDCKAENAHWESSVNTIHIPKGEREKYVVPNGLL